MKSLAARQMKRPNVQHYAWGKQECLDVMQEMMTEEEFRGHLVGNIIKYLYRYRHKGTPVKDLEKAQVYLRWLLEVVAEPPSEKQINELMEIREARKTKLKQGRR